MGWQVLPPTTQVTLLQGLPVPTAVVQAATSATGTSPVSVSFASPVTAGNSIIVSFVSSIATAGTVTPASGPDTFTADANVLLSGTIHGQYAHVSNSAGGYSSVTATLSTATLEVYAYEILGTCLFDATTTGSIAGGSWSFSFTPGSSAEFLPAMSHSTGLGPTLTTPPPAPWITDTSLVVAAETIGSYQFVSSAAAVTYSGAWSSGAGGAVVGGYKLTNPGPAAPANQCILYYFGGSLYAVGSSGNPVLLATT